MAKSKTKPELRFAGFTEGWEETNLEAKTSKIGDGLHGTPRYIEDGGVYFINGNNLESGFIKVTTETKQVSETQISENDKSLGLNTLLISINGTIGNLAKYNGEKVMLGKSVAYLNLVNLNRQFTYLLLQSPKIQNYFSNSLTGSTIKNLGLKAIRETKIVFPSPSEQKLIGNFFENLDNLIAEHQQKHEKLKALKKAMLAKMFPQEGQTVPEIRFKGFSGDWVEKKLSELSIYSNGKGYEAFQASSGQYELVNLNSISIDGGLKPSGKFISHADMTLKENDLVMVLSDVGHGDLLGRVALIPIDNKYVLNQRVALLRPNKDISPHFLYYNINSNQFYFKTQGAGMSQLNLSKKSVEDFTSLIPKEIDEQIKIADYLKNIDNLISSHGIQIVKLKNIKKAFLAKMFI